VRLLRNVLAVAAYSRSARLDRPGLQRLQERKLLRLIRHAHRHVPFYRERWGACGIDPRAIRSLEDLEKLPIVTKREMQAAGPAAITSRAFDPRALVMERTSGSSGRPFTVQLDPRFASVRRALFLRALLAIGYRPGQRLLMLTSGGRKPPPSIARWRATSYKAPPDRILDELDRFRPHLLYGWVTPLRQIALHARATGRRPHAPHAIVTTAETLDPEARRLLEETFGSRAFELYGLTEMGTAAWQCTTGGGFHLAEDASIPELPGSAAQGVATPLVMTNLELYATPFIRFETGDLAVAGGVGRCACGSWFRRLERVEGRLVDCVRLRDGRLLSPFELTLVLEGVEGLERYQVVQEDLDRFTVRHEGPEQGFAERERQVRQALERVLGTGCRICLERRPSLDPPAGRKFRVVESRFTTGAAP
jgi:phenylacetate-CoA ligase